jgi:hypothetical protein
MYHPDLREEIRFLKARLLYKTKKLEEATATNSGPEIIAGLATQIKEMVDKMAGCQTKVEAQEESENQD